MASALQLSHADVSNEEWIRVGFALHDLGEPEPWTRARLRRIVAAAQATRAELIDIVSSNIHLPVDLRDKRVNSNREIKEHRKKLRVTINELLDETWEVPRPGRSMPPAPRVAEHWHRSATFPSVRKDEPHCFRCFLPVARWNNLDRAHLCDRWSGGLDHAANLVLLCRDCHRSMPHFGPEAGGAAIRWVQDGEARPALTLTLPKQQLAAGVAASA